MQIYISHAAKDRDLAKQLADDLESAGFHTWNPEREIMLGSNWASEVSKALESSDIMLVLVSPASVDSDFVRKDVQYALTSGNYRGRVIPIWIGAKSMVASSDLPWVLKRLNSIDLGADTHNFQPVVERLETLVKAV